MDKGFQHILVDCAEGHQVVAKATAVSDNPIDSPEHVLRGNQPCFNEQVSQSHSFADDALPDKAAAALKRGRR